MLSESRHPAASCFRDIIENIERIDAYVAGLDRLSLDADPKSRDAIERCPQRITEAVVRLGDRADALAPGQPWRQIRDFGNVLRHACDQLNIQIVWGTVFDDFPVLRTAAADALARLNGV